MEDRLKVGLVGGCGDGSGMKEKSGGDVNLMRVPECLVFLS